MQDLFVFLLGCFSGIFLMCCLNLSKKEENYIEKDTVKKVNVK